MRKLDFNSDAPESIGPGYWYMAKAWPTMYGYTQPYPWIKTAGSTFALSSGTHPAPWVSYGHFSYVAPTDGYTRWFLTGRYTTGTPNVHVFRITNNAASAPNYTLTNYSIAGGFPWQTVNGAVRGFDMTSWGANCYITSDAATTTTGVFAYTGGTSIFAQIANSPNAHTIECFKDFIIVGNINNTFGGGIAGTAKMIAWSDQGNPNVWTPAAGVQANWAELRDSPGRIVAIRRLGDQCIVYMEDAMYSMTYIGGAYTWRFEKIVDGIGADDGGHQVSVINAGNFHLFTHRGRAYVFDGSRPRPISQSRVEKYLKTDYAYLGNYGQLGTSMIHHQREQIIEFGPDALIYHYGADRWALAGNNWTGSGALLPSSLSGQSISTTHRNWTPLSATHTSSWGLVHQLDTWPTPYPEIVFGAGAEAGTTIEASWRAIAVVAENDDSIAAMDLYLNPVGNYARTQHLRNVFVEFSYATTQVDPRSIQGTLYVNPIPSRWGSKEGSYTLQAWNSDRSRVEVDKTGHFFQFRMSLKPQNRDEVFYFTAPSRAEVTDIVFDFLPAGRD